MYTVTNGTTEINFTYLKDANDFINANHDWYLVTESSGTDWQTAKIKEYTFSGVDNLTINHNAGRDCDVVIYNEDNDKVNCSTTQLDDNNLYVEWDGEMTGRAVVTAGF